MAVYTQLTDAQVNAFLAQYDAGELVAFTGIAEGVENTNYLLETTQAKFILTLYEKRVNPADLPFFLEYMEWIADRGIPCPRPLHGTDGEMVRELAGKKAAMVTFLEGRGCRSIRNEHLSGLGEKLAAMHLAGEGFGRTRENALALSGWRPLFEKIADRADEVMQGLRQLCDTELDFLEAHWPKNLPEGIIHADLFPDNVFFTGEVGEKVCSGLIDFYFACHDQLVYDIAICLNAWCFELTHEFNITRARHLLHHYHAIRPISEAELEALPVLARGAALRFLLTRTYDWLNRVEGALVKPKDPMEYVLKLQFHQQVKHHGEYGL